MSLYVLDSDILSLYRQSHPTVVQRVASQPPADVAITVISVEESLTGWYTYLRRARQPAQQARAYAELGDMVRYLARWTILPYTVSAIARYGQLLAMSLG